MSIQGGVRPEKTFGRKIKSLDLSVISLFALLNSSAQVAVQQGGIRGGAGPPSPEADQGFIRRSGDQMIGALGFAPKLVTLTSSEVIDIAQDTINFTSRLIVSNGGSNLLKALDGGGTAGAARFNGQIMFLQGVATETIEIVHNPGSGDLTTGNFQTISGNNYIVQGDEIILCQFDSTDNKWLIISTGFSLGQTPAVGDIDFATFDGINIDRLRFVIDSGAPAAGGDPSIYLDGSGDMVFNVALGNSFFGTIDNITSFLHSDGNTELISTSGVQVLELINADQGIIDLEQVGEVRFVADDDAGGLTRNTYGRYLVNADDVTSTSKEGRSSFLNMVNNVSKLWMQFNLLGNDQIDFFSTVSMQSQLLRDCNDILPDANNTRDLGLTTGVWAQAFIAKLQLRQAITTTISADATKMLFEVPTGVVYQHTIDGQITHVIQPALEEIRSFLTANTAQYNMFQDVVAGIRAIGLVEYNANRTTGGKTAYVQTFARAENISNTNFAGSYNINVAQAGALVTFMSFNFSQDGNIRAFKPLDMDGNDIILDLDGDSKFVLGSDDILTLNLAGGAEFLWNTSAYDIGGKYMQLTEIAVPPQPGLTAGRIFLDAADNILKIEKNSGTVSLEGGGGGVTFPITPDVDVRGNVSTNQAVDISQTDGHVTTMTLTADITVTFSGFPASGKQQTWEVHILQDATGGRTPTFSPAPIETVSVSKGVNKLTILTFLTNDGGTDIHVVPSLRGSISLSGDFANKTLSNLGTTAINANLNMGNNTVADAGAVVSDIFTIINAGAGGNVLINSNDAGLAAKIAGDWLPNADDTYDLGDGTQQWRDLYIDGSANIDTLLFGDTDASAHTMLGFIAIADKTAPSDPPDATSVRLFLDSATGELSVQKFTVGTVSLEGGGSSFVDNVFEITGNVTPTDKLVFQVDGGVGTNTFNILGTADTYTFPNGGGEVIMSQGNQTIGGFKTFTGPIDFDGNVDIGNATSDTLTITARLDSDIDPTANKTQDVGGQTLAWASVFTDAVRFPETTGDFDTRIGQTAGNLEYRVKQNDAHLFKNVDENMMQIFRTATGTARWAFNDINKFIENLADRINITVPAGDLVAIRSGSSDIMAFRDDKIIALEVIQFETFNDASRPTPSAAGAGAVFYSNQSGDNFLLYSDGTNWRNVHDNATT